MHERDGEETTETMVAKPSSTPGGGAAVEEAPQAETEASDELAPLHQIILFDDDEHSYQYVIEMMMTIFSKDAEEGYRVAYDVDFLGQAVVKICSIDEARRGLREILQYGPDPNMEASTGSMRATIQLAGE